MTEDNRPKPTPEASGSREATAGESSSQAHGGFCQTLRKFKKNVSRKVSKRLKRARHQPPAVQNVTSWVHSVSFSPDGTRIVSGSQDSTVRVWDAATGLPLGEPFRGHTSWVHSVSFSPYVTRIVSGSQDSTVRVWDAATASQFQEHTEFHSSASSSHRHRTVCFASRLEHALHNPAELLETTSHEFLPTRLVVGEDGWMVGADRRLLFWVPPPTREQPLYVPGTVCTMPSGLEIDLSRMSHGESWANCRDAPTH